MKYEKTFPFFVTKTETGRVFSKLSDRSERQQYFEAKAGGQIKNIKKYLEKETFIAYLLAKKTSGKGTYAKQLIEVFGPEKIAHISVGDLVRSAQDNLSDNKKSDLFSYLQKNYRGYVSLDEAIERLMKKDQSNLLPTEFTLTLLKKSIEENQGKSLLIDGFPRDSDQIPYALFLKNLIDLRSDPDVFVMIDAPETVIEARMESRVVCPKCHTPRSKKFLPTPHVFYENNDFHLACDNPHCDKEKMISKIGDREGIASISERMKKDGEMIERISSVHGVSKILLRNAIPLENSMNLVDGYEITPEYYYELSDDNKVITKKRPWVIKDDEGQDVVNLLAPAVTLSFIGQLHSFLGLNQSGPVE